MRIHARQPTWRQPDPHVAGQIITYAAGLDAGVLIWISREFREEHRQALDCLNRVKWSRSTATTNADVSPRRAAYQQFFQRLLDELREKHKFTNARAAQPQSWYSFSSGTRGFSWAFSFALGDRVRAEVYIDTPDADRNEQILDELMNAGTDRPGTDRGAARPR